MNRFARIATFVAAAVLWSIPLSAQQSTVDSLAAVIRALQARIEVLERARGRGDTTVVDELAALRAAASSAARDSTAVSRPQQAKLGPNAMNPEISLTGDVRAYARQPGKPGNTFVAREFEVGLQSPLDPFSTAKVTLAFGEGEVDVEEAYVYFTSLPGHLRLDLGKFRQQVGELNRWHLHALPEDEYPLVMRRFAGDEGLASTGASLYWPLPFSGSAGAYELTVQGTTGNNDVLFAGGARPSVNAQLAAFWQFSRSTFAQVSVSGLYGTNSDTSLTTTLGVAAARFSWRPPQRAQARELTLRGEVWSLRRTFDLSGDDAFNAARLGGYADATWKLNRRWIGGIRGDYVESPDPGPLAHEWAVTPSLTFWQSEFVYVRGIYEHARTLARTSTNRLTLQLVFSMGPHKHELF